MCLDAESLSAFDSESKMNELASTGKQVELSVVMPCLNERETVGRCVRKAVTSLREAGINGEVIVSDNGSTDGSVEIAESEGALVIHVADKGYQKSTQLYATFDGGRSWHHEDFIAGETVERITSTPSTFYIIGGLKC